MKRLLILGFLLACVFAWKLNAQEKQILKLVATTPLPGFSGDFDHFAVDLKGNRLFLTAEDHSTVEVFNLKSGERIKSIEGFAAPHAMLFLPGANQLIVTDDDDIELVDGKDYKILKTVKLVDGVDCATFDPVKQYYYVQSGPAEKGGKDHLINIIDIKTFTKIGDFSLPGAHSEAMAIDRAGKKMYVNLTSTKEVAVVDLVKREVISKWAVPGVEAGGNALVLDEPHHRVMIATRRPAKFFVYDSESGKLVTELPVVDTNDDMWLDAPRKRIYVTGNEMTTVFEQKDADHYVKVADVPTGFRGRTSVFVPKLNRLYISLSGKGKPDAKLAVQIYDIQPQ